MLQKIKDWLASHSITTHTVAVAIAAVITVYEQVPEFHDFVLAVYAHIPNGFHSVITVALAIYAWYRRGQTPPQP